MEQADLTSLEVLGMAVKSEIDSAQSYRMMGKKVRNRVVGKKLALLMEGEVKHRAILEDLCDKTFPDVPLVLPEDSAGWSEFTTSC